MSWKCEKCGFEVSGALPCCPDCEPEFGGAGETKTDMVTVSAAEVDQAKREAQVCRDMHEALGIKWGDDPYWAIKTLRAAADALKQTRSMAAESLDPATFERLDKVMEPALQGVKDATRNEVKVTDVLVWDGKSIDALRQFVAPRKVDCVGSVAGIRGVDNAEMLVLGNRVIKGTDGQITVEVGK